MSQQSVREALEFAGVDTGTKPAPRSVPAPRSNLGTAMRGVVGARRIEDLPYSHRCGARWDGIRTAHCGRCCRTFAGVGHFDAHRKDGKCLDPATIGMTLLPTRAFPCWGRPEVAGA